MLKGINDKKAVEKKENEETLFEKELDEEISDLLIGFGFSENDIGTLFYKEVIKIATRYLNDLYKKGKLNEAIGELKMMVSNLESQLYQCAYNAECGKLIYSSMIKKGDSNDLVINSIIGFKKTDSRSNVASMHDTIKRAIPKEQTQVTNDNYWYMVYVFANYIFNKINLTIENLPVTHEGHICKERRKVEY